METLAEKDAMNANLSEKQVSHVLDHMGVTPPMKMLLFAACLGYLFDAFNNATLGYVMPLISQEFHIDPVAKGLIISAALWGGVIGQYFWGPIADIKGRRYAFQGTILSFSVFTGLTAFAWGPISLFIARFVTGTGLAGFIPVDSAMVSEMSPTRLRGRFASMLPVLFPVGSLAAAATALFFLDDIGWRGMFLVGVIPALIAFWARVSVPESPRWLASKGRGAEAAESLRKLGADEYLIKSAQALPVEEVAQKSSGMSANLSELFSKRWLRSNVLSWTLWISVNFAYFGVLLWLPSILVDVYHFSVATSLTMTIVTNGVGFVGRLCGVYLIEKIGRKPLIIYTYILTAAFCLAIGNLENPAYLLALTAAFFFFADQSSVGVVAYIPELYPTRLRVLGSAWAAAAGRIASALAPIMAGVFMQYNQYGAVWVIFATMYLIAAVIVWSIGPETKGKTLEEVFENA